MFSPGRRKRPTLPCHWKMRLTMRKSNKRCCASIHSSLKPIGRNFVTIRSWKRFRTWSFVRDKEVLFDRWLNSQEISTFEGLRDLILLEDFKNCLPKNVATYVSEHKDLKPSSAAVLADDYVLSHKSVNVCSLKCQHRSSSPPWALNSHNEPVVQSSYTETRRTTRPRDTVPFCVYCKQRGHILFRMFRFEA